MERFFQLMERESSVAAYLISHVVSLAYAMEIDPTQKLKFPLWLAAQPALEPLWPKVVVVGAARAKSLQQTNIEGRWTGDEESRKYVGYAAGKPCLEVTLDREQDVLQFNFL